ncbi:hypothetical protein L5515_003406 [Caenorhabditis briggsae]|uniref:Uncharacterized protein n=1 Tax=Caenorhabditis briggsae TaxID=6238 RepID=A0AAE9EES6_CAEBR|nr:hypothetical protein L5515_003406 [Caenorhabditis briggsae]
MNLLPDPPTLFGLRYRTLFQILQIINGIRYLICPDYLNHKQPIPTYISISCILIPSAISFFLALDEKSRSWEIVQNLTYFIGFVYVTLVTSCLYFLTDSNEKKSENVWDQMLYWHELFTNRQEELSKLYKDAVIGKRFGMGILRTLCSIRTFVTLIIDGKSPKVLKKFAVKGPSNDKACIALQQLLRQEDPSEMNRKKTEFANGFMIVPDPIYEMTEKGLLEFGTETAMRLSPEASK